MKKTLPLFTQTLLTLGLFATSAQAEFTGWFAINNRGVGGKQTIPGGSPPPIAMGNWQFSSSAPSARYLVGIQTFPEDALLDASGFVLTSNTGIPSAPGATASLEIFGDPSRDYLVRFALLVQLHSGAQLNIYDSTGLIRSWVGPDLVMDYVTASVTSSALMAFELTAGAEYSEYLSVQAWEATAVVPPSLAVARSNNTVLVSWPSPSTGFVLQQNANLGNTNGWSTSGFPITTNVTKLSITVPSPKGNLFFRLFKPS